MGETTATVSEINAEDPEEEAVVIWEGVLAIEGKPTDDRRYLIPGEISERELPLSLMVMTITDDGHKGASLGGKITEVWREQKDGGVVEIWGRGPFDSSEFGQEAARLVENEFLRGVSVDLAISEVIPLDSETFEPIDMEDDPLTALFGGGDHLMGIKGTIMGATLVPFPAFEDAHVAVADSSEEMDPRLAAALDRLSLVTQKERYEGYKLGLELGILSLNDVLGREGLPSVEGGDERIPLTKKEEESVPAQETQSPVQVIVGRDEQMTESLVAALNQITDRLAAGDKLNESVVASLRQFAEFQASPPNITVEAPQVTVEPQIEVNVPETPVTVNVERGRQHVDFIRDASGFIQEAVVEEGQPSVITE